MEIVLLVMMAWVFGSIPLGIVVGRALHRQSKQRPPRPSRGNYTTAA